VAYNLCLKSGGGEWNKCKSKKFHRSRSSFSEDELYSLHLIITAQHIFKFLLT